uniref:Glycosyltransferase family 92 protein n=1 Tax=Esox lucius TaxID=8010 RepID=A0AAY5JYB7_ESOLU
MAKRFSLKTMFSPLLISVLTFVVYYTYVVNMPSSQEPGDTDHHHLGLHHISEESITPVSGTRHFMVGAYMEDRIMGHSLRIISIFRQDSVQPLYCVFYCGTHWANGTEAVVHLHPEFFAQGFPFVATDVLCQSPPGCYGSHVTISTQADFKLSVNHTFLRIQNLDEETKIQFNFTVCVSNIFGDYNNVLQVTQTLEMYRLLGVQHVVLYNTSCGPDLETLLQSYKQEGFVEVLPWPIDQYMKPSPGWLFGEHGGDIHYYGQLATLNDCLYRQMYRSRYVLLNDLDEIITPYQHETLPQLMEELQREHPKAGVFLVENHIIHKNQFDPSGRFEHLWSYIPGRNIMEHIYRQEPIYPYSEMKMIVQPRFESSNTN